MFLIPIYYIKITIYELYTLDQREKEKRRERKKFFINRKNRIAGAPNKFIPAPKEYPAPIKNAEKGIPP